MAGRKRAFQYRTIVPRVGIGGSIAAVAAGFRDNLTSPGFTVPVSSTVNVSGGGAALQTAVTAAGPGTRLLVTDSAAYNPVAVTGKTDLTIEATGGASPSITAVAGPFGTCVSIGAGNSGLALRGFSFIGSGNVNGGNQTLDGLINGSAAGGGMATFDRLIVEECIFTEPVATVATGVPGIQLVGTNGTVHSNVLVKKCQFFNNAAGTTTTARGYGVCTVAGFTNVFIQNSAAFRQNAVIARTSSHMRGFTWKSINVVCEDCLGDDLGTAGSNENFKHHEEAIFGTAVGSSSVRNCVAYNAKRGYRMTLVGATMTVTNSVFHDDVAGILAGQIAVRKIAGATMIFRDNVIVGAGDGTAFEATGITETFNDVFNFGATGVVLAPSDLTIDPLFQNVPQNVWVATAPALQTAASDGGAMGLRYPGGTRIFWVG